MEMRYGFNDYLIWIRCLVTRMFGKGEVVGVILNFVFTSCLTAVLCETWTAISSDFVVTLESSK